MQSHWRDIRRILRNIGYIFGGGVFRAVLTPLFLVIIARRLGAEDFGGYSFAFSLASILLVLGDMGLSKLVVRELSPRREEASRYLGGLLLLRLATGAAGILVLYAFIRWAGRRGDVGWALLLIGVSLVLSTGFRRLFDAIFQALEEMKYQACMDMVDVFLTFGLGVYAVRSGWGLQGVALAMFYGSTVASILDFLLLVRKVGRPRLQWELDFMKSLIKGALPFAGMGLITFLFGYMNTVIISLFRGDWQAGLFSGAYRVVWGMALIPATVMTAVFPYLSRTRGEGKAHGVLVGRVVKYLSMLSLPFSLLLLLYSRQVMELLYGAEYSGGVPALAIMAAAPVFSFAYIPLADLLNAHYRHRRSLAALLTAALVNAFLCLVLVQLMGISGAAVATLAAEAVLLAAILYFSWRDMGVHPASLAYWRVGLAALVAGVLLLSIRPFLPMFAGITLYFLFYFPMLRVARAFDGWDRELVLSALRGVTHRARWLGRAAAFIQRSLP
jgi:O-antigen/teichoic acid export membrane protein